MRLWTEMITVAFCQHQTIETWNKCMLVINQHPQALQANTLK
jgi:hypothetical protein